MSSIEVLASAKSFWRLPLFTQKQIVLWLVLDSYKTLENENGQKLKIS